ncbi:lysophospholipase L1-like esterase [Gramella sp. Hel_I_59]|uniref:rhamnogalacturonan acetylesterase n=1 Tax=Gramella sp. Hel_I_59 TaxID=1249978 RepID=UPI00114D5095|nr:rhamnogalacturonan acetylesterase [Gramella sp. Hel_I_59]TQI69307.1 lysophospholipase L1-like esterase [Gramella sp. Hel_I_59]
MNRIVLLVLILFSMTVSAQNKPTLYLIGDSTMSDKQDPDQNPEHGWGQMLSALMTSGIEIDNHAVNGRSTRSFLAENRWNTVKNKLKPGDYVFIQFGHNDQKIEDAERYTNPYTQYRSNLEKFVRETKEMEAKPVLLTSIVRRCFNEQGVFMDTHGEYPLVVRMVSNDMDIPLIDMQLLTEQLEIAYGPEDSKTLHLHIEPGENNYKPDGVEDDTHLSKIGATIVASLALQEFQKIDLEIKKYIKPAVLQKNLIPDEESKE